MGPFTVVVHFIVASVATAVKMADKQKQPTVGMLMRREQQVDERHDDHAASFADMAHGCQHVFLDVGSNRGVHVRSIYEPDKYPLMSNFWSQALAKSKFYEMYMNISSGKHPASNVCTFGFEANPDFTSRLHALEEAYQEKGLRARWFNLAVSDSAGNLTFYREPLGEQLSGELASNSSTGSALAMRGMLPTTVPTIDFYQFMQDNIVNRQIPDKSVPATVVMKMDIEGAEFKVLPRLLQQGLMCKGHGIDAMTLEWHEGRDPVTYAWGHDGISGPGVGPKAIALHKQVSSQVGGCQPTDILDIDDEIDAFDQLPLPNGRPIPPVTNAK
jgi:FkbM family methyltransferase